MKITSELTSTTWWKDASRRALYTVIAVALPYFGASLLVDVPWTVIGSVAGLAAITSLVTSLAGLPARADVPWWLSALERTLKTFFQGLTAGLVGASLLSDVAWTSVLQAAVLSALVSLLRFILATLGDPAEMQVAERGPDDPWAPATHLTSK